MQIVPLSFTPLMWCFVCGSKIKTDPVREIVLADGTTEHVCDWCWNEEPQDVRIR